MAERLKGLLDSVSAKLDQARAQRDAYGAGGLLGDWGGLLNAVQDSAGDASAYFAHGNRFGTQGMLGDTAEVAKLPMYMAQGSMPAPETQPLTSDYFRERAGVAAPQGFVQNAAYLAGQITAPGLGELGAAAGLGGKLAMFLGAKAKTALPDVLSMAQEMEKAGASADDIWLATGAKGQPWYRGADDQWKFWISDKGAEYTPGKVVATAKAEHKAMLDEAEAASMMRHQMDRANIGVGEAKDWFRQTFGREPPEGAGQWLRNYDADTLTKRYLDLEARAEPSYGNIGAPLSRFLNHPQLYEAVPELANMPVRGVTPGMLGPGTEGQASLATGIEIRDDILPMLESGKSVLSHEIQHPIQELMGFGRGGTPDGMAQLYNEAYARINYLQSEPEFAEASAKIDALWDDVFNKGTLSEADALAKEQEIIKQYPVLSEIKKNMTVLQKVGTKDSFKAYQRLAGETEARNTQSLLDKGPEDWSTFRPWLTQDVPTDQQIVRFWDGPALSFRDPPAKKLAQWDSQIAELERRIGSGLDPLVPARFAEQEAQGLERMKQQLSMLQNSRSSLLKAFPDLGRNGEPLKAAEDFAARRAGKAKPYKEYTGAQ